MTVLTLVLLALFVSLGRWQWERADFKSAQQLEFAAGVRRQQALGNRSTQDFARYARLSVSGEWDVARQFLLDNRTRDGRAGYEVLTPLRLEDGRWLLVNRGWVPFRGYRDALPDVAAALTGADGRVDIRGVLDELPTAGLAAGRAPPAVQGGWPRVTAFPRAAELRAALARPGEPAPQLEARVLLLDEAEPNGYIRGWKPFARGPEQNWSYAIQWWGFAVLLLVLYVALNLKKDDGA
jgi:surfeit locus 1 family protein